MIDLAKRKFSNKNNLKVLKGGVFDVRSVMFRTEGVAVCVGGLVEIAMEPKISFVCLFLRIFTLKIYKNFDYS